MKSFIAAIAIMALLVLPVVFVATQTRKEPQRQHLGPSTYLHGTGAATAYIAAPEILLVVILPDGRRLELSRQQIEHLAE